MHRSPRPPPPKTREENRRMHACKKKDGKKQKKKQSGRHVKMLAPRCNEHVHSRLKRWHTRVHSQGYFTEEGGGLNAITDKSSSFEDYLCDLQFNCQAKDFVRTQSSSNVTLTQLQCFFFCFFFPDLRKTLMFPFTVAGFFFF